MLEALVHPVGDRPVVVQGREYVPDGLEHMLHAADVQEGFLLSGERGIRQVFSRRAGADCK